MTIKWAERNKLWLACLSLSLMIVGVAVLEGGTTQVVGPAGSVILSTIGELAYFTAPGSISGLPDFIRTDDGQFFVRAVTGSTNFRIQARTNTTNIFEVLGTGGAELQSVRANGDFIAAKISELQLGVKIGTPAGTKITGHYSGTATWDPADMASDGDATSTTITVTNCAVGDPAFASHPNIGTNDVLVSAHVEAEDTIRVVLMNKTGAGLDVATGTARAACWQY